MNVFPMQPRPETGEACLPPSRPGAAETLRRLRAALAAPGARLRKSFSAARRRRAAIRQLSVLSDRQLADIGISRSQIEDVVDGLVRAGRRGERDRA